MMKLLLLLAACGTDLGGQLQAPAVKPVADTFVTQPVGTELHDAAVLLGGDVVVVGCASGFTTVARLAEKTRQPVWSVRSASPCAAGDNWTAPRVAISGAGAIWVAAYGWGRGAHAEDAPVILLRFDADGALQHEQELAAGERVRAIAAFGADRIAIAGQSATIQDRSSAFVTALEHAGTTVWRTPIANPHVVIVESLATTGTTILVGAEIDGTAQDNRESVGTVTTLRAADGAIAGTWSRRIAKANVHDVFVGTAGDGAAYVVYKLSEWAPSPRAGAMFVEPLADKPAWRRELRGTNHVTPEGIAVAGDRLAIVATIQGGEIDLGRGPIRSTDFDHAAYAELSTTDGSTIDARELAAGVGKKVFIRDVTWDGAAFFTVGEVDDQAFAWRVGAMSTAMR